VSTVCARERKREREREREREIERDVFKRYEKYLFKNISRDCNVM
jgi:hypothetical protein